LSNFIPSLRGATFFIEQKQNKSIDPSILAAQFKYANVLLGMSILKAEQEGRLPKEEDFDVCTFIRQATAGNSRVLLPIITSLGSLTSE